jgi:hypothetical protein
MKHWSSTTDRLVLILVTVFCAAATPVVPQQVVEQVDPQAAVPGVAADVSVPPSASHAAPLAGPRLRPEWPRVVEPGMAERSAAARPPVPAQNTIVISTLALVLIAVIVTILVVK